MEAISLPLATIIIQILGLPGLVFIIWHFDNKRDQRKDELRRKEIDEREKALALTLTQYREDVAQIKRLYENNVYLVQNYEGTCRRLEQLYSETISVISLNTQTQTHLVESIRAIREDRR
ncbi:MAG: hypothetical protein M0036_17205 [Desulfobacteraceae bacterium]|nr:hypothetical protein [Desulfobacteraceae bacterium]